MNSSTPQLKIAYIRRALLSITVGTVSGLILYEIFLRLNIAIFGWNLGLIFAPLTAGYVETVIARRVIGEGIGAISAFILFVYTTFYSFILHNPTLGFNFITIGAIAVILQAAFPTAVNFIIYTVGVGLLSHILGIFKRITSFLHNKLEYAYYKYILKKPHEIKIVTITPFDEMRSNEIINNLDFIFVTSTDISQGQLVNLGMFNATVIMEKDKRLAHSEQEHIEIVTLNNFKKIKDQCLIKLAKNIKAAGGNGVMDLEINYGLIGLGGDSYQITAMGMGVYLSQSH